MSRARARRDLTRHLLSGETTASGSFRRTERPAGRCQRGRARGRETSEGAAVPRIPWPCQLSSIPRTVPPFCAVRTPAARWLVPRSGEYSTVATRSRRPARSPTRTETSRRVTGPEPVSFFNYTVCGPYFNDINIRYTVISSPRAESDLREISTHGARQKTSAFHISDVLVARSACAVPCLASPPPPAIP